jgi:hypothetical protein
LSESEVKNFCGKLIFILIFRIGKIALQRNLKAAILIFCSTFTELIFAGSDFIFVMHINLLIKKLKNYNLIECLKIKRKIMRRYSCELFCTITYNFGVLVIDLYWILVRVMFYYMKSYHGKNLKNLVVLILKIIIIRFYDISLSLATFVLPVASVFNCQSIHQSGEFIYL